MADSRVLDVDERLSRLQVLLLDDRVVRAELDRAVVLGEEGRSAPVMVVEGNEGAHLLEHAGRLRLGDRNHCC